MLNMTARRKIINIYDFQKLGKTWAIINSLRIMIRTVNTIDLSIKKRYDFHRRAKSMNPSPLYSHHRPLFHQFDHPGMRKPSSSSPIILKKLSIHFSMP